MCADPRPPISRGTGIARHCGRRPGPCHRRAFAAYAGHNGEQEGGDGSSLKDFGVLKGLSSSAQDIDAATAAANPGWARDGVPGPVTMAALDQASRLRPRSANGRAVEVDLRRQLLLVAVDGRRRPRKPERGRLPGITWLCAVHDAAMDWLWATGALPIGGRAWVY